MAIHLRKFAEHYAHNGWPVFPVHYPTEIGCSCGRESCQRIAKHPLVPNGALAATTDVAQIAAWWSQWPQANIASRVGGIGEDGAVVIDIDSPAGRVADLGLSREDLETVRAFSGGGGEHLFYQVPAGTNFTNSNVLLPDGIDVRAGNGYLLLWPSRHASGQRYRWQPGHAPWQIGLRSVPDRLLPRLKTKDQVVTPVPPIARRNEGPATDRTGHPYAEAALHRELQALQTATAGGRNNQLNLASFKLGQFVGAGFLDRVEVEQLLTEAALAIGLGEAETRKTIQSGLEAGLRQPRRHWPDLT